MNRNGSILVMLSGAQRSRSIWPENSEVGWASAHAVPAAWAKAYPTLASNLQSAIRNWLLGVDMTRPNPSSWRLDRRINLSVLVQLLALASLIVGSWLNLQRQLDGLQRDVTMLLKSHQTSTQKLEVLSTRSLWHEYRVQAIEKQLGEKP